MKQQKLPILSRPYPLPETNGTKWKMAAVLSLAVLLFLLILRWLLLNMSFPFALLGAAVGGVTVFIVLCAWYFAAFSLFPRFFREERWTVGREIVSTLLVILLITLANIAVGVIFDSSAVNWPVALKMAGATLLVGIAPTTASIIINQRRLLNSYRKKAESLNREIAPVAVPPTSPETPATFTLLADNGKDKLEIPPASLLAITSADNYIKCFYLENGQLKQTMLRSSLQKAADALAPYPDCWRCHRTAIVNLQVVESVSGTAQGYRLHIANLPDLIPVSRSLNGQLRERLAHHL